MGLTHNLHSRLLQKKNCLSAPPVSLEIPACWGEGKHNFSCRSAHLQPLPSASWIWRRFWCPSEQPSWLFQKGWIHAAQKLGTIPINNTKRASHRPQASPHHPLWCLAVLSPLVSSVFPAWSRLLRSVGDLCALLPLNNRILSADPTWTRFPWAHGRSRRRGLGLQQGALVGLHLWTTQERQRATARFGSGAHLCPLTRLGSPFPFCSPSEPPCPS